MERNHFVEVLERKRDVISPPAGRIKNRDRYFRHRLPIVFSDEQKAFMEKVSKEMNLNLGSVVRWAIEAMQEALE